MLLHMLGSQSGMNRTSNRPLFRAFQRCSRHQARLDPRRPQYSADDCDAICGGTPVTDSYFASVKQFWGLTIKGSGFDDDKFGDEEPLSGVT